MTKVINVTQQQFEAEVLNSKTPVLVDFYASWCPPCRALGPILDRLAAEFEGQLKFVKINTDEEQDLARQYQVTGLPTLAFFQDGEHLGQAAGLPDESALRQHLVEWVAAKPATSH